MPLRNSDIKVLQLAQHNGNSFTKYYFAGFEFEPWQLMFHHCAQPNVTIIGGVGSGKTVCAGVSYATWAAMVEGFSFMNVAPTSWQSSLMYADILRRADAGTYHDKFITNVTKKPYPKIELYNGSTMEFMTSQDDIVKLRSWEGDAMHGDEFGYVNTLATTLGVMRSRLRGKTASGRPRLGKLSMTTTSTDNPDLWDRFDRAADDPKLYLSFAVRSDQNPHLTERDLMLMREDIPEELRAVEMDAERPTGRGVYFPLHVIQACEDAGLNDIVHRQVVSLGDTSEKQGFVYEENTRVGMTRFQMPYLRNREYMIAGDPGIGDPPRRNSSVVAVFDITGFPADSRSQATMVAFAWIYGGGRYEPFEQQFKSWWEYYRCGFNAALESTGPQRSFAEYAFTLGLQGQEMTIDGIDMSGNKKNEALQATIQMFQRGKYRIPFIRGLRNQLVSYTLPDTKLAQDLVSMMMTASSWLRRWRFWGYEDNIQSVEEQKAKLPSDFDMIETHVSQQDPRIVRSLRVTERPGRQ